jgi:hypothetical protein
MNPQEPYEAKLAWAIWQALEKLNGLLWDRYKEDFLSIATEKEDPHWESTTSDTEEEEDYDSDPTPCDMEQLNASPPQDPASSKT